MKSGCRKIAFAVLLIGGVLIVVFAVMLVKAFEQINDEIDRCDDTSSGKYLTDNARRAVECPGRGPAVPLTVE